MPSLNSARFGAAAVLLSKRHLYAIGGVKNVYNVEVLDIFERKEWSIVQLSVNEFRLDGDLAAFAVSNEEVILLARKDRSLCAGVFNAVGSFLVGYKKGIANDYCWYNKAVVVGKMGYVIGRNGHVHVFDVEKKEFSSVEYAEAYP
eukprot:TRINITY_DN657_c0_g3_i11.p2 TRINITY_DN657_c0_g3~~TRINITY_DN657_c0_g3_i11.p2  ORF type:complete len:146 (-),score=39.78 TRINITY_DN657_c0_g3_i11:818-1255(-)